MYLFDTVAFWTEKYKSCVNAWAANNCAPFFAKYAPDAADICTLTLNNALSKLSGLFDTSYPAYSYGYYHVENRRIGSALSADVVSGFSQAPFTVCSSFVSPTERSGCLVAAVNTTQQLSCNHAVYANDASVTAASALCYMVPVMVSCYLLSSANAAQAQETVVANDQVEHEDSKASQRLSY